MTQPKIDSIIKSLANARVKRKDFMKQVFLIAGSAMNLVINVPAIRLIHAESALEIFIYFTVNVF